MTIKLKAGLATLLSYAGLSTFIKYVGDRRSDLIITFHRVLSDFERTQGYDEGLVLSTRVFEDVLIYLKQHFHIVSLNTMMSGLNDLHHVQRIAITFDDGWRDTFKYAFPLLVQYQVPATVFICTSLIGSSAMLPEERLALIFNHCVANACTPSFLHHLGVWGGNEQFADLKRWRQFTQTIPMTVKLSLTAHLESIYGLEQPRDEHLMTWREVQTMASYGIEIGSHTASHATLIAENRLSVERELKDSRDAIAAKIGSAPRYLSYPNGAHNHAVVLLAQEAGYSHGFTTEHGGFSNRATPFTIPRVDMKRAALVDRHGHLHPAKTALHLSSIRQLFNRLVTSAQRT